MKGMGETLYFVLKNTVFSGERTGKSKRERKKSSMNGIVPVPLDHEGGIRRRKSGFK
jgi:hypothetical protein